MRNLWAEGGGDLPCHADRTAQWDSAAAGIRAVPQPGREQHHAQESEILLNIKGQLEAEIATTACWKKGGL